MPRNRVIKTHEKFVQDVENKFPNKYTILGAYTGSQNYLDVIYNECGHKINTKACKLIAGKGCPICSGGIKLTQEQFEKRFRQMFQNYKVVGTYINNVTKIKVRHTCGCEFDIIPSNAFSRKQCNCPKCNSSKNHNCVPYINDIYTTNKEMYNLLKYKEDGHKYKATSHKKIWFICPFCKNEIFRTPQAVNGFGLQCPNCSSGISYPERLMSIILSKLNINYKFQFSPEWIKPYRYDFEFEFQNQKYIVEMDGGWHYSDNNLSGKTLNEIQQIDNYKDIKAKQNNYIIIRIDCDYKSNNREKYLKDKILDSKLVQVLNLSIIDWEECLYLANIPMLNQVIKAWNNGTKTVLDLMNMFSLSDTTVWRYLKIASECNAIHESIEDIKQLNLQRRLKVYGSPRDTKIRCNETGEIFRTMKEAQDKYHGNIRAYFLDDKRKHAGRLPDGTRLTWTKI